VSALSLVVEFTIEPFVEGEPVHAGRRQPPGGRASPSTSARSARLSGDDNAV
jgi:hypothetical protein